MSEIYKFIALPIAIFVIAPAEAATTVYSYQGFIDQITANKNQILGSIQLDDTVTGYFTSGPGADAAIAISIGGTDFRLAASGLNYVRAQNDVSILGYGTVDRFSHGFDSNGPTTDIDPYYIYALTVELIDTSATVFDGSEILPVNLDLADFDVARWTFQGTDLATRKNDFRVSGIVTKIAVPEPSATVFILCAVAFTLLRHRRD